MLKTSIANVKIRRKLAGALLATGLAMAPVAAIAQVVVIVNGAPITAIDIEQRAKLSGNAGKPGAREQALRDLIDDKLKISKARVYGLEVSDKDVDDGFATMAKRQGMTVDQFNQLLQRSGIAQSALKGRIRAELTWNNLVRGKFGTTLQIGDSDVNYELKERNTSSAPVVGYVYTLYPVTVIVSRGVSQDIADQKRREASDLRGRFLNCNDGLAFARALRDVAVREPIMRSSADIPPALAERLGSMEVGRLTEPENTAQGIQMYALCNKKESSAEAPIKREVRDQLFNKRFDTESKKFLEEIRKQAMIEYK